MTLTQVRTAGLKNFIRIHGNADDQKPTETIDLNIKTNLTVSNSKGSKFIQKSIFVLVLFFTGTFTILLFNVRRESQALKSQEQYVEKKIAILITKYEKLNNQLIRLRSQMNYNKYYQTSTTSDKTEGDPIISVSNSKDGTVARHNALNTAEFVNLQDDIANAIAGIEDKPQLILKRNSQENSSLHQRDDFRNAGDIDKNSKINIMKKNSQSKNENRFTRPIQNTTDILFSSKNLTDAEPSANLTGQSDEIPNDSENDDNSDPRSEPRTARMRRDNEGRGKIRTKNKRRPKRSRRRLGPLVATFIGGIPEQHITDRGAIGPWVKLTKDTSLYDLQKFHLVDNKKAIEITMNGLYMVSAQVFYFGQQMNYSYWILLNSEGQSTTQRVTKCSTVSSTAANEVSCHTNVVLPLRRGDRLHIQQQERDRFVNLREGHSYVQLVLLSNDSHETKRQLKSVR